jgi:hypothetical protein
VGNRSAARNQLQDLLQCSLPVGDEQRLHATLFQGHEGSLDAYPVLGV